MLEAKGRRSASNLDFHVIIQCASPADATHRTQARWGVSHTARYFNIDHKYFYCSLCGIFFYSVITYFKATVTHKQQKLITDMTCKAVFTLVSWNHDSYAMSIFEQIATIIFEPPVIQFQYFSWQT